MTFARAKAGNFGDALYIADLRYRINPSVHEERSR
jgi:hypothetical protein